MRYEKDEIAMDIATRWALRQKWKPHNKRIYSSFIISIVISHHLYLTHYHGAIVHMLYIQVVCSSHPICLHSECLQSAYTQILHMFCVCHYFYWIQWNIVFHWEFCLLGYNITWCSESLLSPVILYFSVILFQIFWEAAGLERGPLSLMDNWGATWKKK
jgi:hypothetical protein